MLRIDTGGVDFREVRVSEGFAWRRFAYAFAFWGGSFYIFYLIDDLDSSTNVWKLDMDGTLTLHIADTGLRIVGAGVSTSVPVEASK